MSGTTLYKQTPKILIFNMRLKYLTLIIITIGLLNHLEAQEQLLNLQIDPSLNNYYRTHHLLWKNEQSNEPMFLPFFDNFNQEEYRPNPDLWIGDNVYINKRFQLFPPDLGVATFDAMDASGHIHANANQFAFPADTLTSQPIRLDSIMDPILRPILVKDSIYMSFYYQPQGRGNAPEEADELTLEFYSPTLNKWFHMWSSKGMTLDTFVSQNGVAALQVFIPLKDSAKFFHSGFQFRFHNLASLAGNNQPDWQSNADQWNIDMVWIDRDRTINDSSFRKIAFVNQPPSMIKTYQSMPYRQYKNDPTNSMVERIDSLVIRNLDDVGYLANYQYKISNQTSQDSIYEGGTVKVEPFKEVGFLDHAAFNKPKVISFFSIYNEPRKTYTITHVINDVGLTGVGDTAVRIQEFSNYYAYDDGTAEAGYGMSIKNGEAAMKFKLNTKDTLRQVQFYFNPTLTGANVQYFNIMVWKNLEPEEVVFTKRVKAVITDGLYNFYTYDLDTSIVLANDFYIGFQQISSENLNIGFDYAVDSKEYLFYNIGEGWNSSIFSGSLMIRPVFGEVMSTGIEDNVTKKNPFVMFPNPLNTSYLNFQMDNINNHQIEIFNITGQSLFQGNLQQSVNVSGFNSGIYLVRIINKSNGESQTQKLIIKR